MLLAANCASGSSPGFGKAPEHRVPQVSIVLRHKWAISNIRAPKQSLINSAQVVNESILHGVKFRLLQKCSKIEFGTGVLPSLRLIISPRVLGKQSDLLHGQASEKHRERSVRHGGARTGVAAKKRGTMKDTQTRIRALRRRQRLARGY
jgi:hypothetical protein